MGRRVFISLPLLPISPKSPHNSMTWNWRPDLRRPCLQLPCFNSRVWDTRFLTSCRYVRRSPTSSAQNWIEECCETTLHDLWIFLSLLTYKLWPTDGRTGTPQCIMQPPFNALMLHFLIFSVDVRIFVHIAPIFSVLLTYSLKINSLLFWPTLYILRTVKY